MKSRYQTRILKIAMWALLPGTIPVGEILAAERGAVPAAVLKGGRSQFQTALLTSEEVRDLPGRLYRLVLTDDRVLWARNLTRTPGGFEIEPIVGAKLVLREGQVIQVKQLSRGAYLSERWKEIQTSRRAALATKRSPAARSR